MLVRYKTNKKGKSVPVCKVYSIKEHPVRNSMIDRDALWAIRRIQAAGGEAYIVGGALRDIFLGNTPKDFDIATSLSPKQVQRLFWNSRIIGRRFKIVHLFFSNGKIIEVTTFRSDEENFEEGNNNIYGTIEQDSRRRDFSINSFYYNPKNSELLDFSDSMKDFEKKRIRSLIPLRYAFSEDPVRMIRAVKYSVSTGFSLCLSVKIAIYRNAPNLLSCSSSRLTDEIIKILSSGHSRDIFHSLYHYRLLHYILPSFAQYSEDEKILSSLSSLDKKVEECKKEGKLSLERAEMFYFMLRDALLVDTSHTISWQDHVKDCFRQAKILLSPITPANFEIEKAVFMILNYKGIKPKKKNNKKNNGNTLGGASQQRKKRNRKKKKEAQLV